MAFIYTRANLKTRMNAGIQGRVGMLISSEDTMNEAVRDVLKDHDLRSNKRRANLSPNLFNGIFDYACPSDLKADAIIDLPGQAKRADGELEFIPAREFEIRRPQSAIAVDDYNGTRVLKVNSIVDSNSITVAELDSLTSGSLNGTAWTAFGDVDSIAVDDADFIKGAGSLKWNITAAGGTTAGLQNADINPIDITDYLDGTSAFFLWHKINSATDITNYILRFGTDDSNYYSKTITTQADGTAFAAGWNLLKFDLSSYSTTGTPTNTNIKYFVPYMTKATGKISESDYKFDWLVLKKGVVTYVKYYSKYGWQSSAGAYKENSTDDSDLLVADTDEFNLFVSRARAVAKKELAISQQDIDSAEAAYQRDLAQYRLKHPSEALILTSESYAF